MEYLVYSQGMQLQAITGWSSFPLIPKTMDHFWKYRLHLYSYIPPWAHTCMHSFIQLTAQQKWEHLNTSAHEVQNGHIRMPSEMCNYLLNDVCCGAFSMHNLQKEASLFETTQGASALQSQHQELTFWTLEVPSVSLERTGVACIYCIVTFCRTEFPSRGKVDITLKTSSKTSNELHTGD